MWANVQNVKMASGKPDFRIPGLLLLACIPFYFINIVDYTGWGDDFARYLEEARNIAEGRPYHYSTWIYDERNTVYAPPAYPVGYPLMLAPLVKIWGIQLRPL